MAKECGIPRYYKMRKEELIDLLFANEKVKEYTFRTSSGLYGRNHPHPRDR